MGCGASAANLTRSTNLLTARRNTGQALSAFFKDPSSDAVKRIVFMRHASATPGDANRVAAEFDLERPLTDKGREQCHRVKGGWIAKYTVCLAVGSEATCATETRDLTLPALHADSHYTLPQLHPSQSNAPECEKMFSAIGHGTLRRFFEDSNIGVDGAAAFRNYGCDVGGGTGRQTNLAAALRAAARNSANGGDSVCVYGHSVFLNAVALHTAESLGCSIEVANTILDVDLGEAQGIELTRTESGCAVTLMATA